MNEIQTILDGLSATERRVADMRDEMVNIIGTIESIRRQFVNLIMEEV
jgi:hypothetical protein